MNKKLFGTLSNGEEVYIYSLVDGETRADVMDYGATILSLKPFGDVDVVGGFDCLECYIGDASYQGATIGRVANRIADASFEIDGKTYNVTKNEKNNCLHGGVGFKNRLWDVNYF